MRIAFVVLVLAGNLALWGCGPLEAGPRWHGPSLDTLGVHLVGCSRPEGPAELPVQFWSPARRELAERPDLEWVSYALVADSAIVWPADRVPVIYVGAARTRVAPARAFAVGGSGDQLTPRPLGGRLEPGELWRKRLPCLKGRVASVLFVGYPRGRWDPDSAACVRLERAR